MPDAYKIVVFRVRQETDGMYTVTSRDLPGVCVVHRDRDRIIDDLPNVVKLWFRRNHGMEVEAFRGAHHDADGASDFPLVTVPAEVAAQALVAARS